MTDPVHRAAPLVTIPDTPEHDFRQIAQGMRQVADGLRRGEVDVVRARDLERYVQSRVTFVPRSVQAEVTEALHRLREAISEAEAEGGAPEPPAPRRHGAARDRARQRLGATLARLSPEPRVASRQITDALASEGDGSLRVLARATPPQIESLVRAAGLEGERAEHAIDSIRRAAATAFHRRVANVATHAVSSLASRLESSQRGMGLEGFLREMWSGQRQEVLAGLERCGARSEVAELRELLRRHDIETDARAELRPRIRQAMVRTVGAAADGVHAVLEDLRQGALAYDQQGRAYELFPGAVERAAAGLGISAPRARALSEGRSQGASLLEQAVVADMGSRESTREWAERTGAAAMLASAIVVSVVTAGAGTPAMIGALGINGAREAVEVQGRYQQADTTGVAAEAGVNTAEAADHARTEANIQAGVAAAGLAFEAGHVGHALRHGADDAGRSATRTATRELTERDLDLGRSLVRNADRAVSDPRLVDAFSGPGVRLGGLLAARHEQHRLEDH